MNVKSNLVIGLAVVSFVNTAPTLRSQDYTEPATVNQPVMQKAEDPFFGDYEGTYTAGDMKVAEGGATPTMAVAQIVPQGHEKYKIVLRAKPLDSAAWPLQIELEGHVQGDKVIVTGYAGGHDWDGQISKQALRITKRTYGGFFEMKQVMKKSPNEGLKAPRGAIVLLTDTPGQKPSLDAWKDSGWVTTTAGIMHKNLGEAGKPAPGNKDLSTKQEFRNVRLHVEFRIPYQPEQREQERGNSGVILADRYEVQVLDSYGLVEGTGDCASIYSVAPPRINASFPPLSWQTYDITFHAPKLDAAGKLTSPARITVIWNGVKVHEGQITLTPTGNPDRPNAASGPLRIQDHGPTVFYKNVWIQELPDSKS